MGKSKEEYRSKSKSIWTSENILISEPSINKNLSNFLGNSTKTVMAYLATNDEVNIIPSFEHLSSLQIPYINELCKYSEELVLSELGFPIPKTIEIPTDIPNLIIIPGRYFDIYGNRIGRGKGHYDKFLSNHMNATFVGISLHQTLVRLLPNNIQDIKMDIIVTEKDVLDIK